MDAADRHGQQFLIGENTLSWWQQILVALGIGTGAMIGGVKIGRKREQQADPAQRIVDALKEEGAATRRAIYTDGKETRETLQHSFAEIRDAMNATARDLAEVKGLTKR